MAATLVTTIPTLVFPNELDTLEFSGEENFALKIVVTDSVTDAEQTVLETTLTFGDGNAYLYDFAAHLNDFLETNPAVLSIYIDETEAASTTVLPCRATIEEGAISWCNNRALSLASGTRITSFDSTEYVTLYINASVTPTVKLYLFFADGTSVTETLTATSTGDGNLYALSWSWSDYEADFPTDCKNKFYATFTATTTNGIVISYYYRSMARPYGAQEIRYKNAFGAYETLLFASVLNSNKPEYTAAIINGVYRNYYIERARTYEAVSVILLDGQTEQAADFLEARTIERVKDNAPLALTEGELKEESTATHLLRLECKWRETARAALVTNSSSGKDIFDDSFDDSFN